MNKFLKGFKMRFERFEEIIVWQKIEKIKLGTV